MAAANAKKAKNNETGKVYIVETPVKNFCGKGAAGVHFSYGKAEVNEGWVLDWFKEHGYKVTEKTVDATDTPDKGE
jgi:hypothetical protein